MSPFGDCVPATLGLEGRGSRVASFRLSRTLISARPPPRDEEMTPLGVRALSHPAVTAERPARVAHLGRVFHEVGPLELLDTTGGVPAAVVALIVGLPNAVVLEPACRRGSARCTLTELKLTTPSAIMTLEP